MSVILKFSFEKITKSGITNNFLLLSVKLKQKKKMSAGKNEPHRIILDY